MPAAVVPMLRVLDVSATVTWYQSIGFTVVDTWQEDVQDGGEMTWAELSFGRGAVMFSTGGQASVAERRDVDLYVYVDDVADVAHRLASQVAVIEPLHDTFYGMREFVVRDINGFWLTFGQHAASAGPAAADP